MMAAILNSARLDSDTAILDSDTLLSSLRFTQKHSLSTLTLTQTNSIWLKLIYSHLTWWWQPCCILPSWILLSWIQPFCTKKNFTHSFCLNLMMAAILNSARLDSDTAILDSDTLLSSLRFTQKHSLSTLTLTQTNSIWLKLIYSHLTWWWQPCCILPSWILLSWIQPFCTKKNFTHSFWLNLMIAAIMNSSISDWASAILDSDTLLSSLRFTQKHSLSTLTLTQTNSIWLKLIHSHLTWWWQWYCILPSWILPSWIQPFSSKLWLQLIQSDSKSFILTQLDDGSHLGFSHFSQK